MIADQLIDLHNKRPSTGEIIVTLFEFCDLNCLFCNQDHTSILGIDTIADKFEQIKLCIDQLIPKGKKEFAIHIMGGEVFSDKLTDEVYDSYTQLVNKIKKYSIEKNIPITIFFITNFVWTNTERVNKFIEDNDIRIMTSYDPAGRFNKNTLEIYKKNITDFKEYIESVNVIITKPTIDKFLNNQTPFFDYLYDNFSIYFDYYGPEKNQEYLLPRDVDVRNFMMFLIDNWPNSRPVNEYFSKTKKQMTCMDTYTVMPDGRWGGCGHFEHIEKIIPIKVVTEHKWLENYDCFSCEHFQRCSLGCFMSNHVNGMRTQSECWLKEVYDYVDTKQT